MARARNIKPGFFANENLADCDPLARLLFAGLWCLADREGRLEDRPKRIRAEVLPYDLCDADELLNQLQAHGFILRYSHGEGRFIQVRKFDAHQNPHMKEAKSSIPAPAMEVQGQNIPEQAPEKHGASLVHEPEQNQKSPADPGFLIPDPGFSDSLIPESKGETAPRKRVTTPVTAKPDDVDPQTWADWLSLRKAKRAPVTTTVVDEARRECAKAGMTLENFLRVWCRRGSQGLEAAWLKPDERGHATGETAYQRSMRERIEEAAPSIARRAPAQQQDATDYFRTVDVPARDVTRHAIEVQP